ncbi:hypothetical protein RhiirA4_523476 [Rhizophagus irregularis]|uniref:Uncharacterized protein n=1 Tax=Rhizophagus irregularis TaxID=588596 RepID=A0A2I1HS98_9GLOM|nr:hypothetical protein RhiirA4_523476 [Rhizophagus irregularis]
MSSSSNSMSVLALITGITSTSTKSYIVNGAATYRPNNNKYRHFDFKLFSGSNTDIHNFREGDLVMFSGKFTYRKGHSDNNPMFLSVNQAILIPNTNLWTRETIPISHPYITASVYLNSNPLQAHNNRNIIKSQCNNIFCSYDKSKYNHDFYFYYDENSNRWTKTLQTIKNGHTKVHISGLYMGYYSKDGENNDNIYHAIQLTELDFDFNSSKSIFSKTSNYDDDDDDDELHYGTPKTKRSFSKKHDLSPELSEHSSSNSSSTTQSKKKKKKVTKNNQLPILNDNQVLYPDKKTVQFNLPNKNSQVNNNDVAEPSDNKKRRAIRGKGSQPIRKSPRKKGGILNIAVNKIIEINDDDDDIPQKSDTSLMDTESDYHTQNDDDMHEEEEEDDISN